jgi:hypothetical protein
MCYNLSCRRLSCGVQQHCACLSTLTGTCDHASTCPHTEPEICKTKWRRHFLPVHRLSARMQTGLHEQDLLEQGQTPCQSVARVHCHINMCSEVYQQSTTNCYCDRQHTKGQGHACVTSDASFSAMKAILSFTRRRISTRLYSVIVR